MLSSTNQVGQVGSQISLKLNSPQSLALISKAEGNAIGAWEIVTSENVSSETGERITH